jgi:hypothetical protein
MQYVFSQRVLLGTISAFAFLTIQAPVFSDINQAEERAPVHVSRKRSESQNQGIELASLTRATASQKKPLRALSPVVRQELNQHGGNYYRMDSAFIDATQTYARMADLSYHLVKGRVKESDVHLEELSAAGWKIKALVGLAVIIITM